MRSVSETTLCRLQERGLAWGVCMYVGCRGGENVLGKIFYAIVAWNRYVFGYSFI